VTNDPQNEQHDDDAIEGSSLGTSFHIPVDRRDIGPHIKWVIISAAASLFVIALATAWRIVG